VISIDRWGANGVEATVEGLPGSGLFKSGPDPVLLTDPVLVDALGQVVGYWIANFPQAGFVAFPFGVASLQIYQPRLDPGERATCLVRTALVGDQRVRSDIDLVGHDGRVRMRLEGWEDVGFSMPTAFFEFILSPIEVVLSRDWPAPLNWLSEEATADPVRCYRLGGFPEGFFEAHGMVWQRALAYLTLSRRERETWRELNGPPGRRTEWLLARVAAKDAVRSLLRERYGMTVRPADVEIVPDAYGRPVVQGAWAQDIPAVPEVSLANIEGLAVALVVAVGDGRSDGVGPGIDVERMGRVSQEAIAGLAFTPAEQDRLSSLRGEAREEWGLRLWCAKEAVAKGLGRGMVGGPQGLEAHEADEVTGLVRIGLRGKMAELFPTWAGRTIAAGTLRDGDVIVATCLGERT
jgi:phosphopantetheinyl transferase